MSTDPATRRAIAQRAIDRAKARGKPIDEDPVVVNLLDAWIRGDIEMRMDRERYLATLALRQEPRCSRQSDQDVVDDDRQEKRADGVNRGP